MKLSNDHAHLHMLPLHQDPQQAQSRKARRNQNPCEESVLATATTTTTTTTVQIAHTASELSLALQNVSTEPSSPAATDRLTAPHLREWVADTKDPASVAVKLTPTQRIAEQADRGPTELELQLNSELNQKFQKTEEDLNKLHFKSSIKHLKEIKDLKALKRRNLNEKLDQHKLTHNNLVVKTQQSKNDLNALHVKAGSMNFTFNQNIDLVKKEEVRAKAELEKSELEYETLLKTCETNTAEKVTLQQKLNNRKRELRVKREPSSRQSKKAAAAASRQKTAHDSALARPSTPSSKTTSAPKEELPDEPSVTHMSASSNCPPALHHPSPSDLSTLSTDLTPLSQPLELSPVSKLLDPWELILDSTQNETWTEQIQQHIRGNFTALPNLERSLAPDLYKPRVSSSLENTPEGPRSRRPFSTKPLTFSQSTDDFFKYRQELRSQSSFTSHHSQDPSASHSALLFGAIGQQGRSGRLSQSPVLSPASGLQPLPTKSTLPLFQYYNSSDSVVSPDPFGTITPPLSVSDRIELGTQEASEPLAQADVNSIRRHTRPSSGPGIALHTSKLSLSANSSMCRLDRVMEASEQESNTPGTPQLDGIHETDSRKPVRMQSVAHGSRDSLNPFVSSPLEDNVSSGLCPSILQIGNSSMGCDSVQIRQLTILLLLFCYLNSSHRPQSHFVSR